MKNLKEKNLIKYYINKVNLQDEFNISLDKIVELFYFDKNEYIIKKGVLPSYIYFMADGSVKYFTITDNNRIIPYGGSKDFTVLGEVSALWKLMPGNFVMSESECYCLAINLNKYRNMLLNDNKFLRFVGKSMANRITVQHDNLISFIEQSTDKRLAVYIIQHSENNKFTQPLSVCAADLGISYRHLIRLFNLFIAKKYLKKERKKYYIVDSSALYTLASDTYTYFD